MTNTYPSELRLAAQTKFYHVQPEPILRFLVEQRLSLSARAVYFFHYNLALRKDAEGTQIYNATIANELGLSERCVASSHTALEQAGLVSRQRMPRPKGCFKEPAAKTLLLCPARLSEIIHGSWTRSTAVKSADEADNGKETGQSSSYYRGNKMGSSQPISPSPQPTGRGRDNDSPPSHESLESERGIECEAISCNEENTEKESSSCYPPEQPEESSEQMKADEYTENSEYAPRPAVLEKMLHEDKTLKTLIDLDQRGAVYGRLAKLIPDHDTDQLMEALGFSRRDTGTKEASCSGPTKASSIAPQVFGADDSDFDDRIFQRIVAASPMLGSAAKEMTYQVSYSVEHGALKDHDRDHALNICLKLIRQGRWRKPVGYDFFLTYGFAPKPGRPESHSSSREQALQGAA